MARTTQQCKQTIEEVWNELEDGLKKIYRRERVTVSEYMLLYSTLSPIPQLPHFSCSIVEFTNCELSKLGYSIDDQLKDSQCTTTAP
uniref:Uncharacterized protein n=1 Tax=Steinernema glaseri TaxID=37863 RepID=A0A1I7ZW60_9BILA